MLSRLCRLPADRSCLLLGPRQTGKSTLVRGLLPKRSWEVDLLRHDVFLRYAREPSLFRREVEAKAAAGVRTVFVDEVQKVPELLDEVHGLIERRKLRFILTGSSARKLKRRGTNLLAGRVATRRLHPLTFAEQGPHFARVMGTHRTFDDLAASYLLGTIEDIQRRIAALAEVGLQELIITPVTDDPGQLELLARHVLEPFQD